MKVAPARCSTIYKFTLALLCVLALTPLPSSAWSFSSIFGGDDDSDSGSDSGNSTVDKSDGSDIKMQQPLLKATDWFLTEEEITASRGGSPRSDMSTYSTGNAVTTFTVTKEFFDSAYKDLSTTKENDRVMLAAWNTDLIPLTPDVDPTGAKSNFDVVFGGIVKRGGDAKILGWANKFLFFQDVKFQEMTGYSYEKIDAMKFLDAAKLYDTVAALKSSLIEAFDVDKEWYYNLFGETVLDTVDPQDTCDGSSSGSS
ncbi:hypothetical protein PRIC2_006100 [Phytophthora ramorum]